MVLLPSALYRQRGVRSAGNEVGRWQMVSETKRRNGSVRPRFVSKCLKLIKAEGQVVGRSLCSELGNIVLVFFLLSSVMLSRVLLSEKERGAVAVVFSLRPSPSTQSPG